MNLSEIIIVIVNKRVSKNWESLLNFTFFTPYIGRNILPFIIMLYSWQCFSAAPLFVRNYSQHFESDTGTWYFSCANWISNISYVLCSFLFFVFFFNKSLPVMRWQCLLKFLKCIQNFVSVSQNVFFYSNMVLKNQKIG